MSIRRKVFTGLARLGELSQKASRAFLYLGAGMLRLEDFDEMTRRSWGAFAENDAEIRSGLNPWEETTYRQFVKAGERLCIVGCGSGRDLLPFVNSGHDVVVIEPSPQPVAALRRILREHHRSATIIEDTIENAVLPGLFDVVLFPYNCYSCIPGSDRIAVLRKVARHLNPDGRVLVTYVRRNADWVNRSVKLAALTGWLTRSDWHLEPYDAIQQFHVEGKTVVTYDHFFAPRDVERETEHAGLRVHVHGEPWSTPFAVLVTDSPDRFDAHPRS